MLLVHVLTLCGAQLRHPANVYLLNFFRGDNTRRQKKTISLGVSSTRHKSIDHISGMPLRLQLMDMLVKPQ